MGRHPLYSVDQILDAARGVVAAHGRSATLAQICAQIGAPSGSIYHRFGSRDQVMMTLWLRSIRRYHLFLFDVVAGFGTADEALVSLAVETSRYCRQFPAEALAMTLYNHERLMEQVPDHMRDEAARINDDVFALFMRLAEQRFPHLVGDPRLLPFTFMAVVGLCYGLIRPNIIEQTPIPEGLDDVVHDSCRAALAVGDRWTRKDH